jgi:hypothetical protein
MQGFFAVEKRNVERRDCRRARRRVARVIAFMQDRTALELVASLVRTMSRAHVTAKDRRTAVAVSRQLGRLMSMDSVPRIAVKRPCRPCGVRI